MNDFATAKVHTFPIDDSLVLVPVRRPGLLLLNSTSRKIWEMLRAGVAVTEIESWLSTAFGVPRQTAEHDVASAISEWERAIFADPPREQSSYSGNPSSSDNQFEPSAHDYLIHGKRFRFLVDNPELEEEIANRFAPLETHQESFVPEFVFRVHRDELGFLIRDDQERTNTRLGLMEQIISVCFPGKQWLAALHAAAIGIGGRCVLSSARTGGGKSTLSAASAASGLDLLTDDLVFIDSLNLEASAIPLAIMLREGSWPVLRPYFPEIDSMPVCSRFGFSVKFMNAPPLRRAFRPCRPVALLFLDYQAEAKLEVNPLSTFDALVRLHETQSWVDNGTNNLSQFLNWLRQIPKFELIYPNLAAGETIIRETLNRSH